MFPDTNPKFIKWACSAVHQTASIVMAMLDLQQCSNDSPFRCHVLFTLSVLKILQQTLRPQTS